MNWVGGTSFTLAPNSSVSGALTNHSSVTWVVTVGISLFAISAFLTYSRHSIDEVYVLMGYSEAELAQLRQFNFFQGKTMSWMTLVSMTPFLGYLLFLRRYFPSGKADAHSNLADSQ